MNDLKLFVWVDDSQLNKIKEEFAPLKVEKDRKAAIGAGASGILPELNFLLVVGALIGSGFLNAVGEDAWILIKKGVARLASLKPNKEELELSLPPNYSGPIQYELIWWIHFNDSRVLVMVGLSTQEEVEKALQKLPSAMESAVRGQKEFSRLVWNGKSWDSY